LLGNWNIFVYCIDEVSEQTNTREQTSNSQFTEKDGDVPMIDIAAVKDGAIVGSEK